MKNSVLAIGLMFFMGCSVVGPKDRGVTVTFGSASSEVKSSGYYLWIPFIRHTVSLPTNVQKSETKTEASSKDMQKITAIIAVNWNLSPERVVETYTHVGDEDDVVERVISPAVSEVLKAATAKMTAEEILSRRIELKDTIDKALGTRLLNYGITVTDVSLVDLEFTPEFNKAIEDKQIAEQRSKQAEYEARRAEIDAKANVNRARGEAQSALILAESESKANQLKRQTLTPELIQYEAISKWNGNLPTMMSGNSIPLINMNLKGVGKENQE